MLGQRLRPYTLWHWRTLAMVESVFETGIGDIDFVEVALAVHICTQKPNSDLGFMKRAGLARRLMMMARRWFYERRLDDEIDALEQYFRHFSEGPRPFRRGGEGGERSGGRVSVHGALYLAAGMIDMGLSQAEAWATTVGMAKWWVAGVIEARGNEISIVGEQMIQDALLAGYSKEEAEAE